MACHTINNFIYLYFFFSGLDKVHAAQADVFHFQNEFIKSQAKRRELGAKLSSLQTELNELHNEIVTTNRSEEKYLQLITREHKLLKLENQLRLKSYELIYVKCRHHCKKGIV
jgi:hypothetical protein